MEDLHCPLCKEEYNTKTKLPRLFPNCGHTFCSKCIQAMIDETDDFLACPEDNVECQFFNKAVGIGCFPLNFALHRFLVQSKGKRGVGPQDRSEAKPKEDDIASLNYCSDHSKVCELICLTDRKVICTDCVLFGVHKNHQYNRMDDFKKEVKTKLVTLENKVESIKFKGFISNSEKQVDCLKEKIDHKKEQLLNMIKENVNSMIEEIRLKEKELEESLDAKFNKFEYALNVIDNTADKLKERHANIERTVNKIRNQVKKREFDYGFLMNSLYSENNVFVSLKELIDELAQLDSTTSDVIDKELEKYLVEAEVGQVVKLVHSCMEVKCTDADKEDHAQEKKSRQALDEEVDRKTHILTPNKDNKTSNLNIDLREDEKSDSNSPDLNADHININSKDDSIILDKSNNDISRSGMNMNKEESVSLIDVNLDDVDSELMDAKNSNNESMNDNSISNIQNTSLLSRNQGLKKNASFFKKNAQAKPMDSPYYPPEAREAYNGFSTSTNTNNLMFLPENYRRGELTQSLYQQTPHHERLPNPKDRFTANQPRDKNPSWNDQDVLYNSRMQKSPVRRPTLTNRFAPISSRQLAVESDTEVNLSRMNINDHSIPQIITEIIKNKRVKAINLGHNSITEIGFEQLLKKLAAHPSLERVYLMNNYLDDSIFVKLEQYAKKLKKINYFNLQNCSHFKNMAKIKKYVNTLAKSGIKIDI